MEAEASPRPPLGLIDYLGAALTVALALLLVGFPVYATPYRDLLADFGGEVSFVVRAALTWLGPAIALAMIGLVGGALAAGSALLRRIAFGASFVLGLGALVGCGVATWWPFWTMASQIKADPPAAATTLSPETGARFPLFRSTDDGRSWAAAGNGLPGDLRVNALAEVDSVWIAGSARGLFVSSDDGATFARPARGVPEDVHVLQIVGHRGEAFAATERGLWQAGEGARAWTTVPELSTLRLRSIAAFGERLAVGTDGEGVWIRAQAGEPFRRIDEGLPPRAPIFALAARDGVLHAGLSAKGSYRLELAATRWLAAGDETPQCLVERAGVLYAGRASGGVFVSPSDGEAWTDRSQGLPPRAPIWMLAATTHAVFVGTRGTVGLFRLDDEVPAFVPSDGGLPPGADTIALGAGKRSLLAAVLVAP